MTKTEARKEVARAAATMLRHHIGNGSEWIYLGDDGEDRPEADVERIEDAIRKLASELDRRGK